MTWQTKLMDVEYEALERGRAEGVEKGIQKGIRQGVVEGRLEIARNLIKMGMTPDQISTATGLTITEIENLQ